jgi:MFS family permease
MVAAIATLTGTVLPAFLVGALGVQIRDDLAFGRSGLGVVLAAFYLSCALGSLHAGGLADRIGPRRSLLLANAIGAACLLAVATLGRSFQALLVILLLGSLGLMIAGPATKVLVVHEVPRHKHGLAFGIQMSAIPLAALLGGFAVPAIGLTLGWRWAFVGGALIPVIGLLTVPQARPTSTDAVPPRLGPGGIDFRPLLILGVATTLGSAAATTMASFFVVTGTDVGFSEGAAGLMLSAVSALVIVLRIGFGGAADRFESAHPQTIAGLFVLSTLGYVCLAMGTKVLFPAGGLIALGLGWAWTGLMIHAVVQHHPHAPGVASGVIVAGLNLGSVLGPLLFGALADLVSSGFAFGAMGVWTLIAAAASFVGTVRLRRGPPGPEVAAVAVPPRWSSR